jgi:RHS repeat-associated protein
VEYLPFGEIYALTGPDTFRRKFTGKEFDGEIGLYFFGSRYYDPQLGRFIMADTTLGGSIEQRDVFNRYAYALNDPINYIDPTGHSVFTDVLQTIAAYALDTVLIVAGVAILSSTVLAGPAASVLGSTLLGAGIGGLTYNIQQSASGEFFSFKDDWAPWLENIGIGALTGAISGGAAGIAGKVVDIGMQTGKAIWAAGGIARIGTNIGFGTAGNALAGLFGELATNAANHQPLTSGLGGATLIGGILGAAGGAASELMAAKLLSRAQTIDELSPLVNEVRIRTNDPFALGHPEEWPTLSIFPRVLDNTIRNNFWLAAPGTLFTGLDAALYATNIHPDW